MGVERFVGAVWISNAGSGHRGEIKNIRRVTNRAIFGEFNCTCGLIGQNDAGSDNGIGHPTGTEEIFRRRFVGVDLLKRCALSFPQCASATAVTRSFPVPRANVHLCKALPENSLQAS